MNPALRRPLFSLSGKETLMRAVSPTSARGRSVLVPLDHECSRSWSPVMIERSLMNGDCLAAAPPILAALDGLTLGHPTTASEMLPAAR